MDTFKWFAWTEEQKCPQVIKKSWQYPSPSSLNIVSEGWKLNQSSHLLYLLTVLHALSTDMNLNLGLVWSLIRDVSIRTIERGRVLIRQSHRAKINHIQPTTEQKRPDISKPSSSQSKNSSTSKIKTQKKNISNKTNQTKTMQVPRINQC